MGNKRAEPLTYLGGKRNESSMHGSSQLLGLLPLLFSLKGRRVMLRSARNCTKYACALAATLGAVPRLPLSRHCHWQKAFVDLHMESPGPPLGRAKPSRPSSAYLYLWCCVFLLLQSILRKLLGLCRERGGTRAAIRRRTGMEAAGGCEPKGLSYWGGEKTMRLCLQIKLLICKNCTSKCTSKEWHQHSCCRRSQRVTVFLLQPKIHSNHLVHDYVPTGLTHKCSGSREDRAD